MVSILKSIYKNPRPYWIWPTDPAFSNYVAPGIIPFESYAEYGNPSGHAFLVTAFYGYLYYVFLYKKAQDFPGIGHEERTMSLSHQLKPMNFTEQEQGIESKDAEIQKDIKLNFEPAEQCNDFFI